MAAPPPSSPRVPGAGARLAPLTAGAKNNPAAVVGQERVTGENMSRRGIGFQRLSSDGGHYFWANYLEPHVNKQPASVKTALCSQLKASLSCLACLMQALMVTLLAEEPPGQFMFGFWYGLNGSKRVSASGGFEPFTFHTGINTIPLSCHSVNRIFQTIRRSVL